MIAQMLRSWRLLLVAVGFTLMLGTAASRSEAQNYETSWLGNSFSGLPVPVFPQGTAPQHVQDDIAGMVVSSDGMCYTNSLWDEDGEDAGIYGGGQMVGSCTDLHSYGRNGGSAIALDDSYVYVAMTQTGDDDHGDPDLNANFLPDFPPENTIWYGVRRYTRNGAPAPFPNGYGNDSGSDSSTGSGGILQVNAGSRPNGSSPYSGQRVSGIAVDGSFLYVSDPTAGQIKKYSLATLSSTPVSTWNLPNPGPMVLANVYGGNFLYVIQNGPNPQVVVYGTNGTVVAGISFAPGVKPSALAFATIGGAPTLLVADQGPDQDIKEYNIYQLSGTPTTVTSPFGTVGGIYDIKYAPMGTAGPLRFNNPTGVGVDAAGNIYVSQDGTCGNTLSDGNTVVDGLGGGGSVLESYAPNKTLNWQLLGLEFIDCADVDPSSENDVFTKEEHFAMDYTKTTPGTEAAYKGYTINRIKYPEDPRLHFAGNHEASAWVREYTAGVSDKVSKFLVTIDMYAHCLVISRFNAATDGECAIPSTMFAPGYQVPDSTGWPENQPQDKDLSRPEWIWRDQNGNGSFDDGGFTTPSPEQPRRPLSPIYGWWVDSNMDVWAADESYGIRHFVCQGLDSNGNPIYDYDAPHMKLTLLPSLPPLPSDQFNAVERIEYYPATDTMYLSGYTSSHPNPNNEWGGVGPVICRYDQWSTNPTLHTGYPIVPPYNSDTNSANYTEPVSLAVAGQYLFLSYSPQNQILIYNTNTGQQAGSLFPGASVGGTGVAGGPGVLGKTDIRYGVRAYQRANGEYEVFNEADWRGKIIMYRWTPQVQIQDLWTDTFLNVQNGLQCSAPANDLSFNWVQEPASAGSFRLRNLTTGQYLNTQAGTLQCSAVSQSSADALWSAQDTVNPGYDWLYSGSFGQGQFMNNNSNQSIPVVTPTSDMDFGWWSAMWGFKEVN